MVIVSFTHIFFVANLRRCLSQQAEVRLRLYNEFRLLVKSSQMLLPAVFEILYPQFLIYYERDQSVSTPLRLGTCIDSRNGMPSIAEPLAQLLTALTWCVTLWQDECAEGASTFSVFTTSLV